ncbi:hypothetical protein KQI61_00315 [Anaerocolumna aminovalerica]|uniref:hypothetical protein n=1 Tax=Anaerocolumna aminovalerica TaxID=1527 RepID=UPI0011419D5C|nr:hypothetical protein [Anaerocolumna aminovalerica]MBU5330627.1 hypothetical protein [Anaerocolumna aminovalerica]
MMKVNWNPLEAPSQNGQSNFGCIGSEYAFYDDGIIVMINREWQFFRSEKSKLSLDAVTDLAQKKDAHSCTESTILQRYKQLRRPCRILFNL